MSSRSILLSCFLLIFVTSLVSCREDGDPGEELVLVADVSGDAIFLPEAPASVELDELVADDAIYLFVERTNHTLLAALATDLSQPGDYFPASVAEEARSWEALIPGIIPAGTKVHSVYFHYDNATYNDTFNPRDYLNCIGQYQVNATVRFTRPVLGVIMRASGGVQNLLLSDPVVGLPSVDYCEHNARHFPGINIADGCRSDRFILSADRKTFTLRNNTDIHHDNYRIILAAD